MNGMNELLPGIFVIPGQTNTGALCIYGTKKTEVYLIDSGTGSADAARIYGTLESYFGADAFTLTAVINTHSHADHAGGSAFFVRKTGCGVWMTCGERAGMENPLLQSSVAWGGCPPPEFETAYFVPEPCEITRIVSEKEAVPLCDGKKISFLPLPGHYFDMTGVLCTEPDGRTVLFSGDAVFGRTVIGKFSIPFLYDTGAFLETLDMLCLQHAAWYVPSHGDAVTDIAETVEMNKIAVLETIAGIMSVLAKKPLTAEELLTAVADLNGITLKIQQYVLIGCTLRSYLSYLYRTGRITYTVEHNRMVWSVLNPE